MDVEAEILLLNPIRSRLEKVKQVLAAASRMNGETYPELSHMVAS